MAPGTASPDPYAARTGAQAGDPLEAFNRRMFRIGLTLDHSIARPVAHAYKRVTPRPVRGAIHNVLQNLSEPVVFINDVLQVRPKRAARTAARFIGNSTVGLAGLFDVAARAGIPQRDNDFGATLARYGIGPGPYLFIPLLGPTTTRDLAGMGVDFAADPIAAVGFPGAQTVDMARTSLSLLDDRTNVDSELNTLEATAADPYATVRSVYRQSRQAALSGDMNGFEALPDLPLEASPPGDPVPRAQVDPDATPSQPSAS